MNVVGTETSDRGCDVCAAGTYASQPNLSTCTPAGACAAGTVQTQAGTSTSPPVCETCEVGTYCAGDVAAKIPCPAATWDDDANSATACVTRSKCGPGQYVLDDGSATSDRTCTPCEAGHYSGVDNAPLCAVWSDCSAGNYQSAAGTSVSDRLCLPCSSAKFAASPNQTSCADWTTCVAGEYVVNQPSASADRTCASCASGQFSISTNVASCTNWQDCAVGSHVENTPSSTQDRSCTACQGGTYTSGPNQTTCLAQGSCSAGTEQTQAGTSTSPTVCTPCAAGTYCAGGATPKVNCGVNTWDNDGDSSTQCVPKSTCNPGQLVVSDGSATVDRTCASCPSGQWSGSANASSCGPWTECTAGYAVSATPTASSDRQCTACASGQFSTGTNAPSCSAWTTCLAGIQTAGTATSDNLCFPIAKFDDTTCDVNAVPDPTKGIYVDAVGGLDTNLGSGDQPVKSISTAISLATSAGKTSIYLAEGTYDEAVTIPASITLYIEGTWQRGTAWHRNCATGARNGTVINRGVVVQGTGGGLRSLTVKADSSSFSPVAVRVTSGSYTLREVVAVAGPGGTGATGASGTSASNAIGSTIEGCWGGLAGFVQRSGAAETAGSFNSADGTYTPGSGIDGVNDGTASGQNGTAGQTQSVTSGLCFPETYTCGSYCCSWSWTGSCNGTCYNYCTYYYAGGITYSSISGSCGLGGSAGGPGLAGKGGGASVALSVVNGASVNVIGSDLRAGNGGPGGPGGIGGLAGSGSSGQSASTSSFTGCDSNSGQYYYTTVTASGGGPGGNGAKGADGGGGAGGPSYAVLTLGTGAVTLNFSGLQHGTGGPGAVALGDSDNIKHLP